VLEQLHATKIVAPSPSVAQIKRRKFYSTLDCPSSFPPSSSHNLETLSSAMAPENSNVAKKPAPAKADSPGKVKLEVSPMQYKCQAHGTKSMVVLNKFTIYFGSVGDIGEGDTKVVIYFWFDRSESQNRQTYAAHQAGMMLCPTVGYPPAWVTENGLGVVQGYFFLHDENGYKIKTHHDSKYHIRCFVLGGFYSFPTEADLLRVVRHMGNTIAENVNKAANSQEGQPDQRSRKR